MDKNDNHYNFGICPILLLKLPFVDASCLGEECEFAVRDEHGEQFFGCSLPHLAKQAKQIEAINENLKKIHSEIEDIANSLQR